MPPQPSDERTLLAIDGVVHEYAGHPVLTLPRWQVAARTEALVVGPSGSGKSTLLHLIAGLLRPTRGRILVAGRDLADLEGAELDRFRGRTIGVVLQTLHLIRALSVRDNLRLAQALAGGAPDDQRIASLLDGLGLGAHLHARPEALSQGEAQRVAIARAVINRPPLILADEPTSALDDRSCLAVIELLRAQAAEAGATLVVVTHDARLRPHFGAPLDLGAEA